MIKRLSQKIKYSISKREGYLDIRDIMMPGKEGYFGIHYIIASRTLDIELFRKDGRLSWHTVLNEYQNKKRLESDEKEKLDNEFRLFIKKIDDEGLRLNKYPVICSRDPVTLLNGTHRIGYYIANKEDGSIPIELRKDSVFFGLNGVEWAEKIGLPVNIFDILHQRILDYNNSDEYALPIIVDRQIDEILLNQLFSMQNNKEYNTITFEKKQILPNNKHKRFYYNVSLKNQDMYWSDSEKRVCSRNMEELANMIKKQFNAEVIAMSHTIFDKKMMMGEI